MAIEPSMAQQKRRDYPWPLKSPKPPITFREILVELEAAEL
jgi:hypothetical protein